MSSVLRQGDPPRPAAPGKKWIKTTKVVAGQDSEEWTEVDDDLSGPTWPVRSQLRLLGQDVPRVDGPAKVLGRAVYTHDVRLPGMVYAKVLCSPHPAAKITSIDVEPAKKLAGVVGAIVLEKEEVKYLGRPIAAVAALTPELAEDGVRAIAVKYEVLPHAVTPEQSLKEGAPLVNSKGNVRAGQSKGDQAEADKGFAECDAVVEGTWRVPVQHHASLETHGVVVDFRGGEEATVYASTQATFSIPDPAANELGLKSKQVTAVVEHMGGGFGSKFDAGIEGAAACRLAKELKRPVHLLFDRTAEFLTAGNRSGGEHVLKAGAKKSGELVAFVGHVTRYGGVGPGASAAQPYIYSEPKASFSDVRSVHTHTDSSRAMRAPGHPQSSFAMEGLMDDLAYAIGMDPIEFRKRNLPEAKRELYTRQLDQCAEAIGWREHPHKTAPDRSEAELKTGIGFALATWGGGGNDQCKVEVRIGSDGEVEVLSGTQDLGTGTRTFVTAIVAEELGLELHQVHAKIGRSSYGRANGSGGSSTSASLSPAVKHAAWNAKNAMLAKASELLGVDAKKLAVGGNVIFDGTNPGTHIAWKDLCANLGPQGLSAQGEWQNSLAANGVGGAQAAKVQIDTLTGEIKVLKMVASQNCGFVLNHLAATSQLNGGMIQALSYALLEERVLDADLGLMLNANFGDYKLAGCKEIPEMVAMLDATDTRGVVGIGEPSVIPGHSAIANAIYNACGVRLREMPMTCDKLLMGLQALKKA
jgi:xanthine dehydrogenase YagR molybdenum-binding subunit